MDLDQTYVEEGPSIGYPHGRENEIWVPVTEEVPPDGQLYARSYQQWLILPPSSGVYTDPLPPLVPAPDSLWWNTANGKLYLFYADNPSGAQCWVQICSTLSNAQLPAIPPSYGATITSLVPNSAVAGSPALTVTVVGTDLSAATVVMMDDISQPTTFISDTQVSFSISPVAEVAGTSAVITIMDGQFVGTGSIPFNFT